MAVALVAPLCTTVDIGVGGLGAVLPLREAVGFPDLLLTGAVDEAWIILQSSCNELLAGEPPG